MLRVSASKRVLVVEDDVDIRSMIELTLAAEGHEVLSAANGAEALAQLRRASADLVLLDLKMPVMDGWEFARRYRDSGGEAPIVILSAAPDAERHVREIGARQALGKPFDLDALVAIVASVAR